MILTYILIYILLIEYNELCLLKLHTNRKPEFKSPTAGSAPKGWRRLYLVGYLFTNPLY